MNIQDHAEGIYNLLDAVAADPDVTAEEYEETLLEVATKCREAASRIHAEIVSAGG